MIKKISIHLIFLSFLFTQLLLTASDKRSSHPKSKQVSFKETEITTHKNPNKMKARRDLLFFLKKYANIDGREMSMDNLCAIVDRFSTIIERKCTVRERRESGELSTLASCKLAIDAQAIEETIKKTADRT